MQLRSLTQSILFRFIVVGLCMIITGSSARYFTLSNYLRDDMTAVVAEQQMALAGYVARDIGHKILIRQSRLRQLGNTLPQAPPESGMIDPGFGNSAPLEALFSAGLLLSTTEGRILFDTSTFDWSGSALQFVSEYAQRGTSRQTSFISKPFRASGNGGPVLPMTLALKDSNNTTWGYLTGFTYLYNPDFLGNLLQARLGQTGSGFLLISPDDQIFVASSNTDKVLTPTPAPGINLLHDRAMKGYRGAGITTNAHGVEEISAMVSVPNTDWFLVSGIATSEALGTVSRVRDYLLRNTILTIILLLLILLVVVPFTLRPLTKATRQAEKMSHGLAPLAPLAGAGQGEVGVLISAFNRLLDTLKEQQQELSRAANHDSLTALPNRRLLADRLRTALTQSGRNHKTLALLFIDLDHFKPVNDTLGHEAGDTVLQMVAKRLVNKVRESDSVARLGGDEFVVLLTNLDDMTAQATAEKLANELISLLKTPFEIDGQSFTLGASIGGVISGGTHDANDLMHWADQLMYRAKAAGRGRCIVRQAREMGA